MNIEFVEEDRIYQSGYLKGYHDAVMKYSEIVRCKDCKHGVTMTDSAFVTCGCRFHDGQKHEADWFCADGERKEWRVNVNES